MLIKRVAKKINSNLLGKKFAKAGVHKKTEAPVEKTENPFKEEFNLFSKSISNTTERFALEWEDNYPCLDDKTANTGFDRHYVYHPAWAARILRETNPALHIDISSTLFFGAMLSAFIPVKFYDYRPANLVLDNYSSEAADLTNLPFDSDSIVSLSCMHTIEHVGLGRYGDALDYDGDIKAINELSRVLKPGGNLLIVLPVGNKPKIAFNAHRIYTFDLLISLFPSLTLKEFTLIPEDEKNGGLVINPTAELLSIQNYGCGCFWFTKK